MSRVNTDTITTQLRIELPPVAQVLRDLNQQLQQHVNNTAANAIEAGIPVRRVTSTGTRQFQEGNQIIDIAGKVSQSAGEPPQFDATLKERRRNFAKEINADLKRVEKDVAETEKFFVRQEKEAQDAKQRARSAIQRERRQLIQEERRQEVVDRRAVNDAKQAVREGKRDFSNNAMLMAGTGLGLLGNAGFPLLNIGFAAMTGNPMGVAVVAVATAVGETARALQRFNKAAIDAADSIGYVSTDRKRAEAVDTAFNAFTAAGSNASTTVALRRRREIWKDREGELSSFNRLFSDTGKSIWTTFSNMIANPSAGSGLGYLSGASFIKEFYNQRKASEAQLPIERKQALNNAITQLMGKPVGIENDPYEVWKRIQTSALDNTKTEELIVARDMLKELKDLNSKVPVNGAVSPTTPAPASSSVGPLFWMGRW